jgi:hypothetical protein
VTDRNKCEPGKHSPFHRGILGGFHCGECGAFDYDGTGEWTFSDDGGHHAPVDVMADYVAAGWTIDDDGAWHPPVQEKP